MKLGIIGTGKIAKAVCTAATKKGYRVMVGGRNLEKANQVAGEMEHFATGGTIANAIHFGEILVLAVPYKSVEEVLRNTDTFRGKIIIDCTNPVIVGDSIELAIGHTTSAAEQIAQMVPGATVVKAYNTAFANQIQEGPFFGPNDGTMFYCGDDEQAKAAVAKLLVDTGFDAVDAGPLDSARLLEPLATLLMRLGYTQSMGTDMAFKLLRRD
ncbi:MAG: NADPH-dependent F420 reductase [Bacteroidota bacterium]